LEDIHAQIDPPAPSPLLAAPVFPTPAQAAPLNLPGYQQNAPALSVHFVKPALTGGGDCSTYDDACGLQSALATAFPGDQVWAAQGVYVPTLTTDPADPRSVTFMLPAVVVVYGGFTGTEGSLGKRNWLTHFSVLSGGNLDSNPRFVRDPALDSNWLTPVKDSGDLRLQASSPAIDAGQNSLLSAGILIDLKGDSRIFDFPGVKHGSGPVTGFTIGMGAYEMTRYYNYLPAVVR
jgi:hypothetical protein